MIKYAKSFILIIILLLSIRFIISIFYTGRQVEYKVSNDEFSINVSETYVKSKKQKYYYVEIETLSKLFNFTISSTFDDNSYIIKDVHVYSDDMYTCILPVFVDGSIQTDILCYVGDDEIIYSYRTLENDSLKLDNFASSMQMYGYQDSFDNDVEISKYGITVYDRNSFFNTLVMSSYNGVFIVNDDISLVKLFKKDIYEQPIQALVSDYYVVADYDESYRFHEFKIINLKTGKQSTIISNTAISMNSYIQGIVDDNLYIIDRSNKKQYKLDISSKMVSLVGNVKKGILYYNGTEFENKSIYLAIDEDLLFATYTTTSDFEYIYPMNNAYYSYKKSNHGYDAYVSYKENPDLYRYLFSVSSMDRIQYIDDSVYFVQDDTLYCYQPYYGVVSVLTYSELFYNPDLRIWVYKK